MFISVRDSDKESIIPIAEKLIGFGLDVVATGGSASAIEAAGLSVTRVPKIHEGRPHIGDMLRSGDIALMIVTSSGDAQDLVDGREIRRTGVGYKVPLVTTVAGARATASAIGVLQEGDMDYTPLQDFFPDAAPAR